MDSKIKVAGLAVLVLAVVGVGYFYTGSTGAEGSFVSRDCPLAVTSNPATPSGDQTPGTDVVVGKFNVATPASRGCSVSVDFFSIETNLNNLTFDNYSVTEGGIVDINAPKYAAAGDFSGNGAASFYPVGQKTVLAPGTVTTFTVRADVAKSAPFPAVGTAELAVVRINKALAQKVNLMSLSY